MTNVIVWDAAGQAASAVVMASAAASAVFLKSSMISLPWVCEISDAVVRKPNASAFGATPRPGVSGYADTIPRPVRGAVEQLGVAAVDRVLELVRLGARGQRGRRLAAMKSPSPIVACGMTSTPAARARGRSA